MEEIKKVITIQTGEGERSVKSLRKEISDLKDALLNVEKGSEDWEKITKKLIDAQDDLNSVTKINKENMDAAKDSIVGMEKEYKNLYNTYKLLSEEQRNSDLGKQMGASLDELHNKLNDAKKDVGNFKDNVGNYTNSIVDAFDLLGLGVGAVLSQTMQGAARSSNGLKGALGSLKEMFKKLAKTMLTNPLFWIAAVVMGVVKAIKSNEDAMNRLKVAFAAFEPIGNLIKNIFTAIGNAVVWVAEKVGDLIASVSPAAKATKELAKAEVELNKRKREYNVLNAKDENRIAKLKNEAAATTDKAKQQKLLNEAIELENQIQQRNTEITTENNRILEEKSKLTANSKEENDALAQSEVDVYKAETDTLNRTKELTGQVTAAASATDSQRQAVEKLTEEIENQEEAIRKSHLTEIQKLEEEKQAWIAKYKAIGKATDNLEKYYNKQIEAAKKSEAKKTGDTYSDYLKARVANDKNDKELGIGTDLLDLVMTSMEEMESATSDLAKSNIGRKFTENLTTFFNNVIQNAQSNVKEHFNFKFEDLVKMDPEDIKDLEEKYNGAVSSIVNTVDFYGGAKEGEDYENALLRIIGEKRTEISSVVSDIAGKGLPVSDEDQERIQTLQENLEGLINSYLSLGKLINQSNEIYDSKQSANFITNGFFGTGAGKQDKNGFSRISEMDTGLQKLGKSLQNSSKLWQDWGGAVSNILNAVSDGWQQNIEKQLENGEISEEQAESQFKNIKAMQYALAVVNMASGMVQCFSDPSLVTWYAKAAAAASVLATGTAQIITIANTEMGSSTGTASTSSSSTTYQPPVIDDTNPFSYTRNVTTADEEDEYNQPVRAYVVESDITAKQELSAKRDTETTF